MTGLVSSRDVFRKKDQMPDMHFISSTNPSAAEIIQSVLSRVSQPKGGSGEGDVAKKSKGGAKRKFRGVSQVQAAKKARVEEQQQNGDATLQVCSLACPTEPDVPPALKCQLCQCLYHPSCVGFDGHKDMFLCKNCAPNTTVLSAASPLIIGSNATTDVAGGMRLGSSSGVTIVNAVPSILPTAVESVSDAQPSEQVLHRLRKHRDEVTGQVINIPTDMARKLNTKKTLSLRYNGLTYSIPPSCFKTQGSCLKLVLPPNTLPQYVCKGGSQTPVSFSSGKPGLNILTMIPLESLSSNEKSTGRGSLANKENALNAKPTKEAVGGTQERHIYAKMGGKKKTGPAQNRIMSLLTGETEETGDPIVIDSLPLEIYNVGGRARPIKKKKAAPAAKVPPPPPTVKTRKYSRPPCHFQTLHIGFDAMFSIFEYLPLPDLLRASEVCRTWRKVATQSSLWKCVRLRGYRITDWQKAIDLFQERNVRSLDLRGMKHLNDDGNRTWHELHLHMTSLGCLRHINFPQCPASVLHAVTEKLGMLSHIAAESIIETVTEPLSSNAKLDLGKFAKLTRLQVLKLRGSVGLVQPSFSFSGGLSELSNLKNLHTLCVTTLKDMAGAEFSFLGSLTNLETLTIGDCTLWTPQNYEDIGKLKKLKFLRLESGGNLREATLGNSLVKLTKLESLELFKFMVSSELADNLQTMAWLRSFSIFSERHAQAAAANSSTMTALLNMPFLTTVQWGIFDSGAGDESPNIPADAIPFLPSSEKNAKSKRRSSGSASEHVTVNEITKRLSNHLSDTIIRVFRVPNVSARRPPTVT